MKSRLGTGGLGQKYWGLSWSRERRKMFGNENDMEDREGWMGGLILTNTNLLRERILILAIYKRIEMREDSNYYTKDIMIG